MKAFLCSTLVSQPSTGMSGASCFLVCAASHEEALKAHGEIVRAKLPAGEGWVCGQAACEDFTDHVLHLADVIRRYPISATAGARNVDGDGREVSGE